ncbi:MAG TPA: hypothetical protein VEV84_16040 [Pyrinomonadaceae bacterium]|nr:hypothetical protein [Pyrinomonadaceae bacterium]
MKTKSKMSVSMLIATLGAQLFSNAARFRLTVSVGVFLVAIAGTQACAKVEHICGSVGPGCDHYVEVKIDDPKFQLFDPTTPRDLPDHGIIWMLKDNPSNVNDVHLFFTYTEFTQGTCGTNSDNGMIVPFEECSPKCPWVIQPSTCPSPTGDSLLEIVRTNSSDSIPSVIFVPYTALHSAKIPVQMVSDASVSTLIPVTNEASSPLPSVSVRTVDPGGVRTTEPIQMTQFAWCDTANDPNCQITDGTLFYEAKVDPLTNYSNLLTVASVQIRSSSGARPSRIIALPNYSDTTSVYSNPAEKNNHCYWDSGINDNPPGYKEGSINLIECYKAAPGSTDRQESPFLITPASSAGSSDRLTWIAEFKVSEGAKLPMAGEKLSIEFTIVKK